MNKKLKVKGWPQDSREWNHLFFYIFLMGFIFLLFRDMFRFWLLIIFIFIGLIAYGIDLENAEQEAKK